MPNNKEVRFLINKETFTFRFCSKCSGSGRSQLRGKRYKNDPCGTCHGSGKEKFTHKTEVPLIEALKELNLIK